MASEWVCCGSEERVATRQILGLLVMGWLRAVRLVNTNSAGPPALRPRSAAAGIGRRPAPRSRTAAGGGSAPRAPSPAPGDRFPERGVGGRQQSYVPIGDASDHRAEPTLLEADLCGFVEGTKSEGQAGQPGITGANAGRRHHLGPAQDLCRGLLLEPQRLSPPSVSASLPGTTASCALKLRQSTGCLPLRQGHCLFSCSPGKGGGQACRILAQASGGLARRVLRNLGLQRRGPQSRRHLPARPGLTTAPIVHIHFCCLKEWSRYPSLSWEHQTAEAGRESWQSGRALTGCPTRTTLTPRPSRPATRLSTATLLAAQARILTPPSIGPAASTRCSSVLVFPVPGGPCAFQHIYIYIYMEVASEWTEECTET